MSADDIKTVLTDEDIDDIILTGGYRNAAGGIYATSVYAFAKEVAIAAIQADRASRAPSPQGDARKYRPLKYGDIIQPGDEFLGDDCVTWNGIAGWEDGMRYHPNVLRAGRRPIDAARSTPAKGGE